MRMERLVVLRRIGGVGPSISLVTVICNSLESATIQMRVFIKLEDKEREASETDENLLL